MTAPGEPLLAECYRGLDPFIRLFGAAEGARVLEVEGAISSLVPSIPQASLFNASMFDRSRPQALDAALARAEPEYAASGISAWGAWVIEGDAQAERIAASHGMSVDSTPRAMGAGLSEIDLSAATDSVVERWDMPAAARLNELGYGVPPGLFTAVGDVPQPPGARCFISEEDGQPAASVVSFDNGSDDCAIFWVATEPARQARGHAKAAMTAALSAAREDGRRTTTLQATKAGAPLYLRMGYRDLGVAVNLWQHREPAPGNDR